MISTMKRRVAALLGVMSMVVGCSDVPVAPFIPDARDSAQVLMGKRSSSGETVPVLERTRSLRDDAVTVVVGPEGGEIALAKAGFRMRIPAGALDAPTAISVTAYRGKAVAYEFAPHGLQFLAPVVIEQDLAGTTAERDDAIRALLGAGYYPGGTTSINDTEGTAIISERMGVRLSADLMSVLFEITHFSGYILATG